VQWKDNPDGGTDLNGHADLQRIVDDAATARLQTLKGPEFNSPRLQPMIGCRRWAGVIRDAGSFIL
jgi:hypothetical protein